MKLRIWQSSGLTAPLLWAVSGVFSAVSVQAAEFDGRGYAMGGVGVTTANYVTASFHNPAMAAKHDYRADFGMLAPVIGLQVDDPDDLFDDAKDVYTLLDSAILPGDVSKVDALLSQLAGDKAYAEAGFGAVFSIPTRYYSSNLFIKGYSDAFLFADVLANDAADNKLDSKMSAYAISVIELGATLAMKVDTRYGGMHFGVSPKYNLISSYNYSTTVDAFDPTKYRDGATADEQGFNIDLGMEVGLKHGLSAGAAIKNLLVQKIDLQPMNGSTGRYRIHPVLTTGLSWQSDYATLAMDVDMNASQRYEDMVSLTPVANDFDDTQMLRLGMEFGSIEAMQLRVGYNKDLQGNKKEQFSAGIGLSPFNVFHLDVGASYGGANKFGIVAQTMLWF